MLCVHYLIIAESYPFSPRAAAAGHEQEHRNTPHFILPFTTPGIPRQEYLPRALVVELCIEDEAKPPDQDWFARATQLLSQVLEEWKRRVRGGEGASPDEVAEAILNSVHCCVAAVGASLPLSSQSCQGNTDAPSGAPSGVSGLPAPLDPSVAQAFRRFGEVVAITAGADHSVGEAICGRCFSLLANPSA